jgi:hypothetical protein
MTHCLKIWPEYYKAIESEEKPFEVRKMDRPFKVGEKLILQEYDPSIGQYTGKECERIITYILKGVGEFGLAEGYCVMGLKRNEHYA